MSRHVRVFLSHDEFLVLLAYTHVHITRLVLTITGMTALYADGFCLMYSSETDDKM